MRHTNMLHIDHTDRIALLYSLAVSPGIRDMMVALLNGASLHVLPPLDLPPGGLATEIDQRRITICRMVPGLLRRIAEELRPDQRLGSVRVMGLGGQRIDWSEYDLFRRCCSPHAFMIVGLGSTESGQNFCEWFVDERTRTEGGRLPIGPVVPDMRVTIIGEDGRAVAPGESGEIVVASRYLGLGYWRDPDLTARTLATDPVESGVRILRTGDLGRMRPDGLCEFVGRNDQQVKLHGHRIEIAEIEFAIGACRGVQDAVVVVRRDEQGVPRSLVTYVEPRSDAQGLLPRDLLSVLAQKLPGYMVPAALHVVERLPRLPNQKVDRVALAQLAGTPETGRGDNGPDPLVSELIGIFERVIAAKGAHSNDNIASLGGDSLHALIVAAEIERKYRVTLPREFIEQRRSVGEIARWIRSEPPPLPNSPAPAMPADPNALAAEINSSFVAQRAPFFERGDAASWMQAVNFLLSIGHLDVARHGLRHLRVRFPTSVYTTVSAKCLSVCPSTAKRFRSRTTAPRMFRSSAVMGLVLPCCCSV